MPLKLTITSFQRLSPGQESTRILEHGSLMIGRAAQNDWILQDPERILSSNHCVIHCKGGGYFLTDTSTNGTFVNDSEQRIPRNQTVQLDDGDHFVLGEYEIEVNVVAEGEAFPQTDSGSITDIVPLPGVADSAQHSLLDLKRHLKRPQPVQGAALTEPSPDQLMPERAAFEPPELIRQSPPPEAPVVDFSPPPPPEAPVVDFSPPHRPAIARRSGAVNREGDSPSGGRRWGSRFPCGDCRPRRSRHCRSRGHYSRRLVAGTRSCSERRTAGCTKACSAFAPTTGYPSPQHTRRRTTGHSSPTQRRRSSAGTGDTHGYTVSRSRCHGPVSCVFGRSRPGASAAHPGRAA